MPLMLSPPPARPRRRRRTRADYRGELITKTEIEPGRVTVTCGCHLVGIWPVGSLDDVVAELVRWAGDPPHLARLGWPRCCSSMWEWSPGEDVAVWHACRLLALVSIDLAGDLVVKRF